MIYFFREFDEPPPPYLADFELKNSGIDPVVSYIERDVPSSFNPQRNVFNNVPPNGSLLENASPLIPISSRFRMFLVLSGVIYLLWGLLAVALEFTIILYTFTAYFRGIIIGSTISATAITLIIFAQKKSESFVNLIRLLNLIGVVCIIGCFLSVIDITGTHECIEKAIRVNCNIKVSYILKLALLSDLAIATGHTYLNFVVIRDARKKYSLMATARN